MRLESFFVCSDTDRRFLSSLQIIYLLIGAAGCRQAEMVQETSIVVEYFRKSWLVVGFSGTAPSGASSETTVIRPVSVFVELVGLAGEKNEKFTRFVFVN